MSDIQQKPLRHLMAEALGSTDAQEEILLSAGRIFADYVYRQTADSAKPVVLTPDILSSDISYPRLQFLVSQDELPAARQALKGIDMKLPTMPGLSFNQLVCCDDDTQQCRIVINAGAPMVYEFAYTMADTETETAAPGPVVVVAAAPVAKIA